MPMRGVYWWMGCVDTMPDTSEVGLGEEYCYLEENKALFSEGPLGYSEMVILN